MGLLYRNDFSIGWQPGADVVKGPKNGLLRADNLVPDERGILALRLGDQSINTNDASGVPVPLFNDSVASVHSLFTTTINGTRYRCAGIETGGLGVALRNETSFGSFDGSGDIIFGSSQGMILATRGTTHWKNDGTNTRTWGIAAPTVAPTLDVLDPRVIQVSTFDAGESPAWTATEGEVEAGTGVDSSPNSCRSVLPNSSTGRGTIQKVFGSAQNYDSFDSGAATGAPEDSIELYVWVGRPDLLQGIQVSFDVNANSNNPFQDDYYFAEFIPGDDFNVGLDEDEVLDGRPNIEGIDRDKFRDQRDTGKGKRGFQTRPRSDTPKDESGGWTKFIILRGQMERVGSTPGANWSTVKAVQITFKYQTESGVSGGTIKFDSLKIQGGSDRTLSGKFQGRYIWARDFGDYIATSGPSPISEEIECRNNAIVLRIPASAQSGRDAQVGEVGGEAWAYLGGGTLRNFLRFATKAANVSGTIAINCTISERDAIFADLRLETDSTTPPDDVVAIIDNHYNRTIVVTREEVWVSQEGNPDSYSQGQVLDVSDPSERIYWAVKGDREVLIGTNRDVYRLSGTLALLADGVPDARLDPMGVNGPPISSFVAADGGLVAYLASDGFRLLAGAGSVSINWNLDTLIQGYTRHGISPLNLGSSPGRFRGGISNGRLYVLAPEGASEASTNVVYVAYLGEKQWRREIHPRSLQSLYREPDGKVLAGDSSGVVWQLQVDTSNLGDKYGTSSLQIPVTLYSPSDDNDQPLQFKEAFDWRADLDTGGAVATVALLLDEAAGPTLTSSRSGYGTVQQTLGEVSGIRPYKRIQQQITGSFLTFKLGAWGITYRDRPVPMLYWDSGFLDFLPELTWFRRIALKARCAQDLRVRLLFAGVEYLDETIDVSAVEDIYSLHIGRECKGRLPRVIVEPASGTTDPANAQELYYLELWWRGSGGVTEKKIIRIPGKV